MGGTEYGIHLYKLNCIFHNPICPDGLTVYKLPLRKNSALTMFSIRNSSKPLRRDTGNRMIISNLSV